jgi:hypothetical protein
LLATTGQQAMREALTRSLSPRKCQVRGRIKVKTEARIQDGNTVLTEYHSPFTVLRTLQVRALHTSLDN